MYDAIIIGAGMSGLAAGIRLAHYEQRVCVLERHYTIGGLNSFYRLDRRDHDVGLHAVTNYAPPGTRRGPLAKVLRQLRFRAEEFALRPQIGSEIAFPELRLRFNNDFRLLESEIERHFPGQRDNLARLRQRIVDYGDLDQALYDQSARQIVSSIITDPLLVEMLFCPLMWYGNARQHDMDFGQFCIMFRSIFLEGFARPWAGVRLILKRLVRRFRELGGELKLRCGVKQIETAGRRACGVTLDSGEQIEARQVISSAGWPETMRMCSPPPPAADRQSPGVLSFVETISALDCPPQELGHDRTIVFFNDRPRFDWSRPEELVDVRTGVVCSPNNYLYREEEGPLPEGIIRVTCLANFDRWSQLPEDDYRAAKQSWYDRVAASAARFVPDFRPHVVATDMFTPKTIRRFTGHDNGAVYGAERKRLSGATHLDNLWLCGTDQGYVGIIGTMMSGVSIANRCLRMQPSA